ncbi:RagB/SusD family nutrient uptake outer membrane protein [Lutibacter sp.]|uniref:RagB/SusD family nutrient uptake outer membrane protein n=1 Tax=Lutibacter sp. TaxID=1925666 RepID=UPI00273279D4|nr:RagB/SusD family nutrient uptake outer membrane protein [Lutibacter sp.]MDP3313708.1 RagB/SusD family nutrient uptake outer membrane protein [Lutibacter sp.]
MKIIYISILFLLFSLTSCKDNSKIQLDDASKKELLTETDALTLMSEVYDTYQNSEKYLIKGIFYPANLLSQNLKLWGDEGKQYAAFNVSPANANINNFWVQSYEGIIKTNKTILSLDYMFEEKIISEETYKRLKGECHFNRGVFYFYLASNFGNVPLVQEIDETVELSVAISTQDEVFSWVVQDLILASEQLPVTFESKSDTGRATKGAALAYLGEAYMWLKQYDKAIIAFSQLEKNYELMPDYIDIHAFKHQNNKESIFEIQFNGNDNLGWGRDNYSTFIQSFSLPNELGGAGLVYANPVLATIFNPTDTRKVATVIGPGESHPDSTINISSYNSVQEQFDGINTLGTKDKPWLGDDGERSGYYAIKNWRAPDPSTSASTVFSKANVILMRYGQVLLGLAEAKLNTGDIEGAAELINKIRIRAKVEPTTSKDLLPVLLNEYHFELSSEYSLWYVLRRSNQHLNFIKTNYNIEIPSGHDLLPIPEQQLKLNKALKQNNGY